jgi:GT2 family glycosyltransferase
MLRRDFPEVHLIASDRNLGFAAGNNAALRAIGFTDSSRSSTIPATETRPAAVLLLNPDTELHPGALQNLVEFLRRTPQAGIAGARLLFGDGSFQHSVFDFPGLWQLAIELLPGPGRLVESRLNGRYPRRLYQQGQPFKVGHPLGAAMCVRREAIDQVGLLDEQYHMYVEEVDWSKRIQAAGWQVYCVPAAKVTHLGGQSSTQIQTTSFVNLWRSRRRFYAKHYSPLKVWLARQIVQLGMRRLARQAGQAAQRGELDQTVLAERLQSYKQVADIWRDADRHKESQTQVQEKHV